MKVLLVVDDMIIVMKSNKIVSPIVTELLLREKKAQCFNCFYLTILFQNA